MAKVKEELKELQIAIDEKSVSSMEEELGDLLFTLTSLARHCHIDAEASLRKSAAKFKLRLEAIEKEKKLQKRSLSDCTPEELEDAWIRVKNKNSKKAAKHRKSSK